MAENDSMAPLPAARSEYPRTPGEKPEIYFEPTPLADNEFEIGLVLGGTVSVGTYTAGVLDFLIEALDCWEKARRETPETTPPHKLRLRIITGTSGGGINAVLAARALHFNFPPAKPGASPQTLADNPFYDIWVNDISLLELLNLEDLEGDCPSPIMSLLDGRVLERIATKGLEYPALQSPPGGTQVTRASRCYLHNPLPVIVTHSNVTGVPYQQSFAGDGINVEYFTNHADYVRLYFDYPGAFTPGQPPLIGDGIGVYTPNSPNVSGPVENGTVKGAASLNCLDWPMLAQFVLGTSAFPVGFPVRRVARNAGHYAYRFAPNSAYGSFEWMTPVWSRFVPADQVPNFAFFSLDGGCTDNEPIELASQSVEGLRVKRSERDGVEEPAALPVETAVQATESVAVDAPEFADQQVEGGETARAKAAATPIVNQTANANRGLILIDPLCEDPPAALNGEVQPLVKILAPMMNMFVSSNRYETANMADFLHESVYTRFLVSPKRTVPGNINASRIGSAALCGTGLGAFLGFVEKRFREHDFMLGRYNCQAFLARTLTLPATNPLFNDPRSRISGPFTALQPAPGELPIIPLLGTAAQSLPEPSWPAAPLSLKSLKKPLRKRIRAVLRSGEKLLQRNLIEKLLFAIGNIWIGHKLATVFLAAIAAECQRKEL